MYTYRSNFSKSWDNTCLARCLWENFDIGIKFAVALLLFSVNIRTIVKLAKNALIAFGFGGVTIGRTFEEGWKVAGMLTGTYIGGSLNLAAVGTALKTSAPIFVATSAADCLLFAIYTSITIQLPPYMKNGDLDLYTTKREVAKLQMYLLKNLLQKYPHLAFP